VAVTLQETFSVHAPIDTVWRFVMDAEQVAACMPGAELEEVLGDSTFHGNIAVKVGAITTTYKGKIRFTQVDATAYAVEMAAEGRETGGGTAKGTMSSRLRRLSANETEVTVQAAVDITGRVAQMGRGMIQGVSKQLFRQFVACASARLEAPEEAGAVAPEARRPISVLPIVFSVIWSGIAGFFRRLFRRQPAA
jgi:carbon monoxide dehydrogenase subunit G